MTHPTPATPDEAVQRVLETLYAALTALLKRLVAP